MNHVVEIRSLSLKPGMREEFHRIYIEEALPLLRRWDFDVVAHGPSLHDQNSYYVIRRFVTLAQRGQMEDAYYASEDWRQGPREAIVSLIEHYVDIVLELDEVTLQALRREGNKNHFVEIRSYSLKPGTREEFHRLVVEKSLPMLKRWNVDVVAVGPSPHAETSYHLIRRYDNLSHLAESESAFYSSDDWRQGPREAIVSLIENYTEVVLALDDVTVQGLRKQDL